MQLLPRSLLAATTASSILTTNQYRICQFRHYYPSLCPRRKISAPSVINMMTPQQQQYHAQHPMNAPTTATNVAAAASSTPTAVYNGVNLNYPGLQQLHHDPPVFAVHNFLTPQECQFLVEAASDSFSPAPVVGAGAGEVSPTRTSSTCYLAREDLPNLLRKVSCLTNKPMEHCELPQVGRYLPSQQYYQHYDAFNLDEEDGRRFAANGGQRVVTVLVYLNDVPRGGETSFPTLQLKVKPVQGMALVFFPATVDGHLDPRALHAALPAVDPKFVSQIWIRLQNYYGQPSKRLAQIMGAPLAPDEVKGVPRPVANNTVGGNGLTPHPSSQGGGMGNPGVQQAYPGYPY